MPLKDSSSSPSVEPLRRVTDLWLDPRSAIRLKAVEALTVSTGYPKRLIERALDNVFLETTREKLTDFIRTEQVVCRSRGNVTVLHVAAGNVFTAWLHGAIITLLMGFRCWVKPSAHEPVFARLWHQSVQMVDFALAERIRIVDWSPELARGAQAIVAYGSDATLAQLQEAIGPGPVFVGYGHKASVAAAFQEAADPKTWPDWRARAVNDSELFELNGCLSPQALWVEGSHEGPWRELSTLVQPAPPIRLFSSLEDLGGALSRFGAHLSCVGVAGPSARLEPLNKALLSAGVRICALGEMQRPPLSWRNGGLSLVHLLSSQIR